MFNRHNGIYTGEPDANLTIAINPDDVPEVDETFKVKLVNITAPSRLQSGVVCLKDFDVMRNFVLRVFWYTSFKNMMTQSFPNSSLIRLQVKIIVEVRERNTLHNQLQVEYFSSFEHGKHN